MAGRGQTVFDPMFISVYNLFYTSLPVLALGIFDQDVNDVNSLKYPKLYTPGHLNLLFNKEEFFRSAVHGCLTSCVLFFIPYGASRLSNFALHMIQTTTSTQPKPSQRIRFPQTSNEKGHIFFILFFSNPPRLLYPFIPPPLSLSLSSSF